MEDIKEQDSEYENMTQMPNKNASKSETPGGNTIQRQLSEAVTKKYILQTQLNRLKDSKNILDFKNQAMGGGKVASGGSSSKGGYKMHNLLAISVVGLMVGAYLQKFYLQA